jgi:transglutaminase-like putative cysteine protease
MIEPSMGSRARKLMLAAFVAGVLLHVDRAPAWSLVVAAATFSWQLAHLRWRLPLPGAVLRTVLAFGLLLLTFTTYRSVSGLSAGGTLLLVMGSAKLLEVRQRRDARVVVMVALALLLAACLERQSLLRLPVYLLTGWLALAALTALGSQIDVKPRQALATSGRTLLLALPLAALCFVLVPRLPGAMWGLPPSDQATTGLGDEMSPGSISELSISEDVAFRVRFEGAAPPPSQRYWRGPVLHDFDGYTWRRRPGSNAVRQPAEPITAPLRYQVMLEATGRNYLFGIDTIEQITGRRNFLTFDGQAIATREVTAPIVYQGLSHLQVRHTTPLSLLGRKLDTQPLGNRNLRTQALARQLRAASANDRAFTERALRYFREGGFEYTLTPPRLDRDSIDDLLFNTKLGFCGHFASAYVTMMRAVGIPARVVTGYLGGTWNPVGGYYVVRQSDAHAWAEVWLTDGGWTRVDPTAVVAPERLRRGLNDLLDSGASLTGRLFTQAPWLRRMRDTWDAASSFWQERIVNYNLNSQLSLLDKLGLEDFDYRAMALLLIGVCIGWGIWVMRVATRTAPRASPDALAKLWQQLALQLQHRGVAIAAADPPHALAIRAARHCPAAAPEIHACFDLYLQLRFGPQAASPPPTMVRELQHRLQKLAEASRGARPSPER